MRYLLLMFCLFLLMVGQLNAQTASYTSESFIVNWEGDNPSQLVLTKPANLEELSRGFKKIKSNVISLEGKVSDSDGVKRLSINNEYIPLKEDGSFLKSVKVREGLNELNFKVIDLFGNELVKTYRIEAEPIEEQPALASEDQRGDYYALIIAIDEYEDDQISDLDKPIQDAEKLMKVLIQNYTFQPEKVTFLTNATRTQIIDEFAALRKKVGPEDNLLIFYAGHGYFDEDSQIGYWIPADGKKISTANWFRNSTLTDEIGAINSKHTLLVADACFSGSIFKTRAAFNDASSVINQIYGLKSRKAMTSGTMTEVPDRSAFFEYLHKRLNSNMYKYLSSQKLFSDIREVVGNNSDVLPQYGIIQKVGDEGGDFVFIRRD